VLRCHASRLCRKLQASSSVGSPTLTACDLACLLQLETLFASIGVDPRSSLHGNHSHAVSNTTAPGLDGRNDLIGSQFIVQCAPVLQASLTDNTAAKTSAPAPVSKPREKLQRLEMSHSSNALTADTAAAVHALSASFLHHHPQQKVLVESVGRLMTEVCHVVL
jgi:hypothetical protein